MTKIFIITKRIWDNNNYKKLGTNFVIENKINLKKINQQKPRIIFFIHWSKIIKKNLFKNFLCIQFHSSNLPNGKGGSPIQNQIQRKIKKTKITAFKITDKIDSGPICMKSNLKLDDNAFEIYKRMEKVSINMIKKIVKMKKISFKKQIGKAIFFKRRTPKESNLKLNNFSSINEFYDFIRMLDAPKYPKANLKLKKFNIEFFGAKIKNKSIFTSARIYGNKK